jgi:transmembrane sensor
MVSRDEYVTAPGAHRRLRLEDGSEVTLAGDSAIRVLYSESLRSVLLERGEALFHVSRTPGRPFTVLAGGGRITALGTEFDVRLDSARVVVGVTDGLVEVAPRDGATRNPTSNPAIDARGSSSPVRLRRGQQLGYDFRGEATPPNSTDAQSIAAWTQGSITYRDRPLKEVMEDVQRYTARRIRLDPAADDVPFSGIFVEQDAEAWIGLLPRALPVDVVKDRDGIQIQLRSESSSGSRRAVTSLTPEPSQ